MKTVKDLIEFGAQKADMKNLLSIPNTSGVYFLCDGSEIIYIGHSEGMRRRVKVHLSTKKITMILFICYGDRIRFAFEKLFIQIFRPKLNYYKPDLPDNIETLLDKATGLSAEIDLREGF